MLDSLFKNLFKNNYISFYHYYNYRVCIDNKYKGNISLKLLQFYVYSLKLYQVDGYNFLIMITKTNKEYTMKWKI